MRSFTLLLLLLSCWACQSDAGQQPLSEVPEERPPLSVDYEDADYKWGFADAGGRLVIPAEYDEVRGFGPEKLALVRQNGEWNFISLDPAGTGEATGKKKSKSWSMAWSYVNGLARVRAENDSIGFINVKGEMVINPTFSDAGDFSESKVAWVKRGNHYGLIDKSGNLILPVNYEKLVPAGEDRFIFRQNRKYGLIDGVGKVLVKPNYKKLKPFAENGLAAVKENDLYGYIDRSGNWHLQPAFLQASNFSEGRAVVTTQAEKLELIDATGKNYLREEYTQLWYANESRWLVEKNGKYGTIDADGSIVIPLVFDEIQPASEGLMVYQQGPGWGFLSAMDGTPITPPAYGLAWPFKNGFARVATNRGLSLIDTTGQLRLPPLYLDLRDGSQGLFPVQTIK